MFLLKRLSQYGFFILSNIIAINSWAQMSIIPLNNAIAEQILPVIQSQLNDGGSATSYQNQIILNASVEETLKIKNLLETLDSAGKQLLITIKNNNSDNSNIAYAGISNANLNDQGLRITKKGFNTQTTTTRIEQRSIKNSSSGNQGLRVTEGYPSFISTGSSKIYTQPLITSNGTVIQNQEWKNAQTGFYATARVNGNYVSIDIEQEKQSFNNDNSINNQQLQTRVSGQLGQWIAIGTINNQETNNNRSFNSREKQRNTENNTIYLKVELAE